MTIDHTNVKMICERIAKLLKNILMNMQMKNLLLVLSCFIGQAFANQVTQVEHSNNVDLNKNLSVVIKFNVDPDSVRCGLNIDWGDGEVNEYRVGKDLELRPPFQVQHIYKTSGGAFKYEAQRA